MHFQKINIAFIIPSLTSGGAERIMSFLAKSLDKNNFNVTLIIICDTKEPAYDIEGINTVFFKKSRVLNGFWDIIRYLKKMKPDIAFSAIGHLNTMMAFISLLFTKTKFVAREVNVLSVLADLYSGSFSLHLWLEKWRFNKFDAVVCQSEDMYDDLLQNYKVKKEKLITINNPITSEFVVKSKISNKKNTFKLITIARLDKEKGHYRILKALSKLNFEFEYTIIGKGILKDAIRQQAKDLQILNRITFIDFTKNVNKHLSESDLYLQGSYVEGFPNAVIESCTVGTPVVAFNAPGGINEIITLENGYIANTIDEYVNFIENYQRNPNLDPKKISLSVTSRYNKTKIVSQYEDLFKALVLH